MMEDKKEAVVVDLRKFRAKMANARYYYNMTMCSHIKLAEQMGIPHSTASRWVLKFNKERKVHNDK